MLDTSVYELHPAKIGVAWPLFADATFDRVHVASVFEGRQPGRVFVDDPIAPTSAFLCRTYEYYLTGEVAPPLRQFIGDAPDEPGIFDTIHDLAAARLQQTIAFYGMVPMSTAWQSAIHDIYDGQLEVIGRRAFRFDPAKIELASGWKQRVPDGFTLIPVDSALAQRIDEEVGEFIGLFWGGYERFGAHGFGTCAMHGDEIAGVTYTVAVSNEEANFGVETVERFRRLGLANVVSQACVAQTLDRGRVPTWDCDLPNQPSAQLALKLGFTEFPTFTEHAFPGRRGPERSMGRWFSESIDSGIRWGRKAS